MLFVIFILALRLLPIVNAQPLAGGGGGGGGGFGGGFDDGGDAYNHDDRPSCPPHCHSCSTDDVCEICYTGYKLMHDGSCMSCPVGCRKCDVHGPFKCDACCARYTLVSPRLRRQCEPCAEHCVRCDVAGPGACDDGQCDWGYVRDPKRMVCDACTKHCGRCKDASTNGCLKCKTFFKLAKGSCRLDTALLAGILIAIAIVIFTYRWFESSGSNRSRSAASTEPHLESHEVFVAGTSEIESSQSSNSDDQASRLLPSGLWRGYYTHSGARHDVCEFTLDFRPDGKTTGSGVDDVGEYNISGICNGTGSRLAFTKTYAQRSRNVSGVVSYGNKGHSVEYRGELVTGEGGALGGGFRGNWAIRHEFGNYNGTFHLWPAMEGWQDPETEAPDREPQRTYDVESECVVCFERSITTSLRPCGHQVLCRECADQLRSPRSCPICRARISRICDHTMT